MSVTEIKHPKTLTMINSTEAKSPAEWEALYPGLWMILEVTDEDECQVYKARLIATAEHDMELVDIARAYIQRGVVHMFTRGIPREGDGPLLVAHG